MSTARLAGRRALVTGAAMGIGQGIAVALAGAGADVAVHFATTAPDEALAAVAGCGRRAVAVHGDLRRSDDCRRVVDEAARALNGLDVLVNSAGLTFERPIADTSIATLDDLLALNVRGYVLCAQRFIALARAAGQAGRILNISSVCAQGAIGPATAYATTKGAVDAFTRALASELAGEGFRVNAIAPGMIEVPRYHDDQSYSRRLAGRRIPLGRIGRPADIGSVAAFLLSDEAGWITGQVLNVDGGTTARLGVAPESTRRCDNCSTASDDDIA